MRYCIADIHGCNKTFGALLEKINFDQNDELYLLGDYIDRGPDSKGVIDRIIALQELGYKVFPLKGNHEDFMLQSRHSLTDIFGLWVRNGARETLNSYNRNWNRDDWFEYVPHEHWRFLKSLVPIIVLDDYILCHASLNWNKKSYKETDEDYLLWERNYYFDANVTEGRSLINGHTPTTLPEIEVEVTCLQTEVNRIILDNGCVYNADPLGRLCCLNLDTKELCWQENIDEPSSIAG